MLPFLGRLSLVPTGVEPGDKRTADEMAEGGGEEEELDGGELPPPPPAPAPGVVARTIEFQNRAAMARERAQKEDNRIKMESLLAQATAHAKVAEKEA